MSQDEKKASIKSKAEQIGAKVKKQKDAIQGQLVVAGQRAKKLAGDAARVAGEVNKHAAIVIKKDWASASEKLGELHVTERTEKLWAAAKDAEAKTEVRIKDYYKKFSSGGTAQETPAEPAAKPVVAKPAAKTAQKAPANKTTAKAAAGKKAPAKKAPVKKAPVKKAAAKKAPVKKTPARKPAAKAAAAKKAPATKAAISESAPGAEPPASEKQS